MLLSVVNAHFMVPSSTYYPCVTNPYIISYHSFSKRPLSHESSPLYHALEATSLSPLDLFGVLLSLSGLSFFLYLYIFIYSSFYCILPVLLFDNNCAESDAESFSREDSVGGLSSPRIALKRWMDDWGHRREKEDGRVPKSARGVSAV